LDRPSGRRNSQYLWLNEDLLAQILATHSLRATAGQPSTSAWRWTRCESAEQATREFLQARAWTRPERPSQLFDQVVAWLRSQRVLWPSLVAASCRTVEVAVAGAGNQRKEWDAGTRDLMAAQRMWLLPVLDGRRLVGVIHYATVPGLTNSASRGPAPRRAPSEP